MMRRTFSSSDDRLLARLYAPPDLMDGMESLAYWHERRRRLSWYRLRARREAMRMITRWERRVRDAMFSQRGASIGIRASAGLLVAQSRMRRWSRRVVVATTVLIAISLMAAPFVGVLVLLTRV